MSSRVPSPRLRRPDLRSHGSRGPHGTRGFTLTEVVVVLAVVAILMAIASPSLAPVIRGNRLAAEANNFAGDLLYARSEAIRLGVNVSVCPSTSGTDCTGGLSWQGGWIVFSDDNASRSVDNGELVLRRQQAWTGTDTLIAGNAQANVISFSRDGFSIGMPGTVVFTLRAVPADPNLVRCVTLNMAGRQRTLRPDGSTCS